MTPEEVEEHIRERQEITFGRIHALRRCGFFPRLGQDAPVWDVIEFIHLSRKSPDLYLWPDGSVTVQVKGRPPLEKSQHIAADDREAFSQLLAKTGTPSFWVRLAIEPFGRVFAQVVWIVPTLLLVRCMS